VRWYKVFAEGKDMREETFAQITHYEEKTENPI
jgi:hypothetical protein